MKAILVVILLAFGAYSAWVIAQIGYFGIWQAALNGPGELQILLDLVIACLLICSWMVRDAREQGRNAWPWVAVTFLAGSFGPLGYLLTAPGRPDTAPAGQYNQGPN